MVTENQGSDYRGVGVPESTVYTKETSGMDES